MYGLVNQAVLDLVVSRFGESTWEAIVARTGVRIPEFARMSAYPDEMTFALVRAASEELGLSQADVMRAFGEHWILYTGSQGYGAMFGAAGSDVLEFLGNLDDLHARVGRSMSGMRPPGFRLADLDDGRVRLHYETVRGRTGLCAMVEGLLVGLGKHFGQAVELDHALCDLRGDEHCAFDLRVTAPNAR